MNIFVLAHINTWTDGIPCYGSVMMFGNRQKAIDWLAKEYVGEYDKIEELLVSDEDVEKAKSSCTFGPIGWTIWEDNIN